VMRFVDVFGKPISQSVPHIYLSALAFAPLMSMIVQHHASLYPSIGILKADRPLTWLDVHPILAGHTRWVRSVAFSPDGAWIASGSHDTTIRLWDAKTGTAIGKPLRGHNNWVRSIAFSPDGARIVSGSIDRTIQLWDAKTGAAIGKPLRGHANWVRSVAFSPDGARIASGSTDKKIWLWDAKTGAAIGESLQGHSEWVQSIAFSPDGARIASGAGDKTIQLTVTTRSVELVVFSSDGTWVASRSMTGHFDYGGHLSSMVVPHKTLTVIRQAYPLLMWFRV
jgi:WD40 repeat protein